MVAAICADNQTSCHTEHHATKERTNFIGHTTHRLATNIEDRTSSHVTL